MSKKYDYLKGEHINFNSTRNNNVGYMFLVEADINRGITFYGNLENDPPSRPHREIICLNRDQVVGRKFPDGSIVSVDNYNLWFNLIMKGIQRCSKTGSVYKYFTDNSPFWSMYRGSSPIFSLKGQSCAFK